MAVVTLWSCESAETKAARFFLKGNEALNDGNYKEAIRFYTEAIDKYPELQDAYNNRGVAYYKTGDYYSAIQDYTKLIMEMNAMHFKARGNRVDANIAAGKYEQAIKELDWVKDFYPDSAAIDFKQGLAYFGAKNYRSSVVSFNIAYGKDSSDVEALVNAANAYYYNNDFPRAYAKIEQAKQLDPTEPNIYNTEAMMAIANRNYDLALEHIAKAIEIDGNNGVYLNNRGFLRLVKGAIEAGGKDVDRAIVIDPQNAWAYRNKGIFYVETEKFEDAIRNFETAFKMDQEIPLIHYYWGVALLKLGQQEEGCAKIRLSIDRFENEGRALFQESCGGI